MIARVSKGVVTPLSRLGLIYSIWMVVVVVCIVVVSSTGVVYSEIFFFDFHVYTIPNYKSVVNNAPVLKKEGSIPLLFLPIINYKLFLILHKRSIFIVVIKLTLYFDVDQLFKGIDPPLRKPQRLSNLSKLFLSDEG